MYLNYDIMIHILDNINEFVDKINFCKVNKQLYLKNYEGIIKGKIRIYIYNDYNRFYKYLNRFNYTLNELNELLRYSLIHLSSQTIWMSHQNGTYDLRFIFELLYNNSELNDEEIKKLHKNFFKFFYYSLKQAIVKDNRKLSKYNLLCIPRLISLHNNFIPHRKKNKESINYINLY